MLKLTIKSVKYLKTYCDGSAILGVERSDNFSKLFKMIDIVSCGSIEPCTPLSDHRLRRERSVRISMLEFANSMWCLNKHLLSVRNQAVYEGELISHLFGNTIQAVSETCNMEHFVKQGTETFAVGLDLIP